MNEFLDRLERILQRRLDTAYVIDMNDEKANIDAELLQIVKELRESEQSNKVGN